MAKPNRDLRVIVPKRYIIVALTCLIRFSLYTFNSEFGKALSFLVGVGEVTMQHQVTCNETLDNPRFVNEPPVTYRERQYQLTQAEGQNIAYGYYTGFSISHLLGGILADKHNTKYILICCLSAASVWNALAPVTFKMSNSNWRIIMGWCLVNGFLLGPIYPTIYSLLGQWIPCDKKTITAGLMSASGVISQLICNKVEGLILQEVGDFTTIFYIWACIGILTCILCFFFAYGNPELHPTITKREKKYLRKIIGRYYPYKEKTTPWKKIFKSIHVWAFLFNCIGESWAWSVMMEDVPMYLKITLNINKEPLTFYLDVVSRLLMMITTISTGLLCDYLIRSELVDITTVRKLYNHFGSMGAGIFAISISYASCNQNLAVGLFIMVICFIAMYNTALHVNILDLAPNFGGTLFALASTFSSIVGLSKQYLAEKWLKEYTVLGWRRVFWFSFGVCTLTDTIYAVACTGREEPWNIPPDLRHQHEELETL